MTHAGGRLAFAAGTTALVGILSSVLPALRGSRVGRPLLFSTSAPIAARTPSNRGTRDALIAIPVAFALVLLTGSGLMVTSFTRMIASDPGYDPRNLVAVAISVPETGYGSHPAQAAFFDRLVEEARSIPGVAAATSGSAPAAGLSGRFVPEGREQDPNVNVGELRILYAGPAYFRVLGIRILRGRDFSPDDEVAATPVAVIDEDAARRAWPGENALGKRFRYSQYVPWVTVVGIAANVKTDSVGRARDALEVYLPESQRKELRYSMLLMRGATGVVGLLPAIRARVKAVEPGATIDFSSTVEGMYDEAFVNPRFTALTMSVFAVLAVLTSAVGVSAMLWYAVSQRTAEIGVRVALGASAPRVMRLVMIGILRPTAAGLLVGLIVAWWLTAFIASQLYRGSPHDPATFALVSLFLAGVAALAAYGPARRATRIDPISALRCE